MEEHKFETAQYENSKEIQEYLFGLGYTYHFGEPRVARYFKSPWIKTYADGRIVHYRAAQGGIKIMDAELILARAKLEAPKRELPPHPYQVIIDKIVAEKPQNWQGASSWLGNLSVKKAERMMGVTRPYVEGDLLYSFNWGRTLQGNNYWHSIYRAMK